MLRTTLISAFFLLFAIFASVEQSHAGFFGGGSKDRVLLRDVSAITLRSGEMTTGRRSQPVSQLNCVGGCQYGFLPDVVQCRNTGWDGNDVQWECRSDMDNNYRFGRIAVSCEGYDYPNDPYVLKGSCGLKYSIELTEEGRRRGGGYNSGYQSNSYGSNYHGGSYNSGYHHSRSSEFGSWTLLVIVGLLVYGVYRFKKMNEAEEEDHGDDSNYTDSGSHGHGSNHWKSSEPRQRYHSQAPPPYSATPSHTSSSSTGGGFWTGAATGGLLGYLFGRNNTHGYGHHGYGHHHGYGPRGGFFGSGYGSGWSSGGGWSSGRGWSSGGGRWPSGGSSWGSSGGSHSSGSRSASGFGGTERR